MSRRGRAGLAALILVVASVSGLAQGAVVPPGAGDLAADLAALTAPEMEGRASGTPGGERAARHVADRLSALGLRPGGDGGTFFQSLAVGTRRRIGPGTVLERLGSAPRVLELEREWMPHGGSLPGEVSGEVVFVGFGVVAPDRSYDDYAGVDVNGKIALALDGGAAHRPELRPSRLEKLIAARRNGARALLLVGDALPALGATGAPVSLASATITRAAADALLVPSGKTTAQLAETLRTSRAPASFATGSDARIRVNLQQEERRAANVIGILPGTDPSRASETVVIGAHYDHLGRVGGDVYPGADDNASGTALVLGLARAFASAGGAARTLVFVLFAGEEIGLLGSDHYVRQPPVPLERTVAMLNFDMVGRLRDRRLSVGGVESGVGFRALVAEAARGAPVNLILNDLPFAPSDHARFYTAGVPTLFFFTGGHEDHHRPTDTPDKVNVAGMAEVAIVAARVVGRLAGEAPRPTYVKLSPPERSRGSAASGGSPGAGGAGGSRRASDAAFFGISAAGAEESDGLRLASIVPGSAAARAGIRRGDVLVRFADTSVNSFADLRHVLAQKRPGDSVTVVYLRDGQDHSTAATLDSRP